MSKPSPVDTMLSVVPDPTGHPIEFQFGYLVSFVESLAHRFPVVAEAIAERTALYVDAKPKA